MTHWTEAADLIDAREDARRPSLSRHAPGVLAFLMSAALGVYVVYLRPMMNAPVPEPQVRAETDAFGGLAPLAPPPSVVLTAPAPIGNPFGDLVVQGFGSRARFTVAETAVPTPPLPPSDLRDADDLGVPLPPRRPSALAHDNALARDAEPEIPAPPAVARVEPRPAAAPGLFDTLFGGSTSNAVKSNDTRLAYAAAPPPAVTGGAGAVSGRGGGQSSGGGFGGFLRGLNFGSGSSPTSRYGDRVAVYDISAHVVYLPDGTKLEAHSGMGVARDDPSHVNVAMRGATPPATYALTPREELFHGVAALRLTPTDSNIYGRAGLLAHTYMLGPDGDSNGCVSFRDYDAFLRAYRNGQITKLVVVTRL